MSEESVWMCIGRLRFFRNDMDGNSELVSRCNRNILEIIQKVLVRKEMFKEKINILYMYEHFFCRYYFYRIVKTSLIDCKNSLHREIEIVNCFSDDLLDYISKIVQYVIELSNLGKGKINI